MSPRRTRPTQRKRRVVIDTATPQQSPTQLAHALVRRGLTSPAVLGTSSASVATQTATTDATDEDDR